MVGSKEKDPVTHNPGEPVEVPTLPTKTTWTLAKLEHFNTPSANCWAEKTHAAVAAKISILLASVANASTKENMRVKTQTSPSLTLVLLTTYKTMIETIGASEDTTVPMMEIVVYICLSE